MRRSTMIVRTLVLGVGLTLAFSPVAFCTDISLAIPSGWGLSAPAETPYAIGGDSIAFALTQLPTPSDSSRVLQIRNFSTTQTIVTTDIPGKVAALEYSADGTRLLVNRTSGAFSPGGIRASIVDASGHVISTRDHWSFFRFSTTGQKISVGGGSGPRGLGRELNIFDATGESVRRVAIHTDGASFRSKDMIIGELVIGSGDKAIVYTLGGLMCVSVASDPPVVLWLIPNIRPEEIKSERVYALDETSVVQTLPTGFRVVRVEDGSTVYAWDTVALAAASQDPARTPAFWKSYEPFAGKTPGTILLFNKTAIAFVLDLATGVLSELQIDNSVPAGFTMRSGLSKQQAVLLSPTEARIRTIQP